MNHYEKIARKIIQELEDMSNRGELYPYLMYYWGYYTGKDPALSLAELLEKYFSQEEEHAR